MTQDERLELLVEGFKADSGEYRNIATPQERSEKRRLLRSLMNIRMPRPLPRELLDIQDEYLRERSREKGIVPLSDIPNISDSLGSAHPFAQSLSLWQGDITRLRSDAIVNAANSAMLGCFQPCHNCIDNCIHSFAGVELRAECARHMADLRLRHGRHYEQPTAVPMLTDGYNLPAGKIVHIVGPIVDGPLTAEHEAQLAACYRNTLDLCAENGLRSVAFCGISTGVFRFPKQRAAEIAVQTVTDWLKAHPDKMDRVIFAVLSDSSREIYENILR